MKKQKSIKIEENFDTPLKVYTELNKHIIGQEDAKKAISVAYINRLRRKLVDVNFMNKITPKNLLMIGSTGVGKTEIARKLAEISKAPFINIALSQYTEVGYHGGNVSSIIQDILEKYIQEQRKNIRERIKESELDKVIEKIAKIYIRSKPDDNLQLEEIINKIKNKELIHEEINLEAEITQSNEDIFEQDNEMHLTIIPVISMKSPFLLSNSKKNKKKKIKIEKAIKILLDQEIQLKINEENILESAIQKVEQEGIVFLDEIDKIISNKNDSESRGEVSREGVQKDLIPIIEGTVIHTKYGSVKTDHILFIAAGAFHISNPEDLMSELKGRFPIKVKLNNLTEEDIVSILSNVEFGILDQYKKLLEVDNIKIDFTKDGIDEIAKLTQKLNNQEDNIGARRLVTVIETILQEISFEGKSLKQKEFKVDKKYIENRIREKKSFDDIDVKKFNI